MAHFTFDEPTHVYAVGSRAVPSVTQVLEAVGMAPDLSHLPEYYRGRGQAIHRAMALQLLGTLDWSTLDERILSFVEHGAEFIETVGAKPLVVEHRWVHTALEYGGTLDLFCDSKLGPLLIDWKSTFTDPAYDVQVAGGYAPLLEEAAEHGAVAVEPEMVRAARMAVVTLKNTMPKPHWIERHDASGIAHAATFQAALDVARWQLNNRR